MVTPSKVPAGIYCRISQDPTGEGLGVERQREDCEKLAAAKGWQVADIYVDNDVSAYSGRVRPEYRRLIADVEEGVIRAVVVWHMDRLHRQPKELESFIELAEAKGVLLASVSGQYDLATADGRLTARLLGAVARMESEHKSDRIKRAHQQRAQAGEPWVGGYRAYGYAFDGMAVVPHEADVIRDAFQRVLAGDSLRSICLDWNSKGERTVEGLPWTIRSVKRVLVRARNAGFRENDQIGLVKGKWPTIVSEQDWKRVRAILNDPSRKSARVGPPSRYLLSGVLRCGECGKKMVSGPRSTTGKRSYVCSPAPYGCHKVFVTADWVEEFVTDAVIEALQNPDVAKGGATEGADAAALQQMAEDRALLDELAVAFSERKITMQEWLAARTRIEARIDRAQATIAENSRGHLRRQLLKEGTNLRELWPSLTVEKQRAIVESVLDHIRVKRVGGGHYKETSRLDPVWKH